MENLSLHKKAVLSSVVDAAAAAADSHAAAAGATVGGDACDWLPCKFHEIQHWHVNHWS